MSKSLHRFLVRVEKIAGHMAKTDTDCYFIPTKGSRSLDDFIYWSALKTEAEQERLWLEYQSRKG